MKHIGRFSVSAGDAVGVTGRKHTDTEKQIWACLIRSQSTYQSQLNRRYKIPKSIAGTQASRLNPKVFPRLEHPRLSRPVFCSNRETLILTQMPQKAFVKETTCCVDSWQGYKRVDNENGNYHGKWPAFNSHGHQNLLQIGKYVNTGSNIFLHIHFAAQGYIATPREKTKLTMRSLSWTPWLGMFQNDSSCWKH